MEQSQVFKQRWRVAQEIVEVNFVSKMISAVKISA